MGRSKRVNWDLTDEGLEEQCREAEDRLAELADPATSTADLEVIDLECSWGFLYRHRRAKAHLHPLWRQVRGALLAHPNASPELLAGMVRRAASDGEHEGTLAGLCRNPALGLLLLEDGGLGESLREHYTAELLARPDLPDILRCLLGAGDAAPGKGGAEEQG